jgi:hypothetical protein
MQICTLIPSKMRSGKRAVCLILKISYAEIVARYGYNPYAPHHYAEQYPRHPQGVGREEILIVSDDRVLALRPVHRGISHPQRHAGDNVSIPSVARPQRYAADNMSVVRP